jgi:formylglycine-generating enzyme required for sulfatase activity/uncharacterized caspase-like protein
MVVDAVSVDLSRRESRAERRLAVFCQRYDDELLRDRALELACYAAFPLTLTTDLIYHLRQQFVGDAPWYYAADVLLSGLCDPVGYDLYEMAASTRSYLLTQLFERWREQGRDKEVELQRLANFVQRYILHRMNVDSSLQAQRIGDPTEWLALALLYPDTVAQKITQGLSQLLEQVDSQERIRLANMVESVGDLLEGLRPIDVSDLRALARKIEQNEPIDNLGLIRKSTIAAGFPELKTAQIEYAKITFETEPQDAGSLQPFHFETVTVDLRGQEISRSQHEAYAYMETLPEGLNLEMVAIPSGKFMMGSPELEHQRYVHEGEQHEVTVSPFFMGKYEVTQLQWRLIASLPQVERELVLDPSNFKGDNRPVEWVSWLDAEEFCLRLSIATGREYRLPSEAEWEYACRAGTTTPFYFGETITEELVKCRSSSTYREEPPGNERDKTAVVGSFPPNEFGLYDMHGNVSEWCLDHWHETYDAASQDGSPWISENSEANAMKVLRGGAWFLVPGDCRSAYRAPSSPDGSREFIGFRVVCSTLGDPIQKSLNSAIGAGRNEAIVIGINNYHYFPRLMYAQQDALAMREFLEMQAGFDRVYYFAEDASNLNSTLMMPTRANLRRMMQELFARPFMGKGDTFWFFFSGHGRRDGERDFLMPIDGDPQDVAQTGISLAQISEWLRGCGADNVVIITDSCRHIERRDGSERIQEQQNSRNNAFISRKEINKKDISSGTGVITIFSCRPDQASYEFRQLGQGAFTKALLEGLGETGACETVAQLDEYLKRRVLEILQDQGTSPELVQSPYITAEPSNKSNLVLRPQYLKSDLFQSQVATSNPIENLILEASILQNTVEEVDGQLAEVELQEIVVSRDRLNEQRLLRGSLLTSQTAEIEQVIQEPVDSFLRKFARVARRDICEEGGVLNKQWEQFNDLSRSDTLKIVSAALAVMGIANPVVTVIAVPITVIILHLGLRTFCEEYGEKKGK